MPLEKLPKNLIDLKRTWIVVDFIHNGENHYFYSVINELSNSRLSGFDSDPPSIDDSLNDIKTILKDIKKKTSIINVEGGRALLKYFNKVKLC